MFLEGCRGMNDAKDKKARQNDDHGRRFFFAAKKNPKQTVGDALINVSILFISPPIVLLLSPLKVEMCRLT